jgi:hypothetical protein
LFTFVLVPKSDYKYPQCRPLIEQMKVYWLNEESAVLDEIFIVNNS